MAIQTVQKTAKKYKAASMLGQALILIGALWSIGAAFTFDETAGFPATPIVVLVIGVVLAAGASFLAWWHHG